MRAGFRIEQTFRNRGMIRAVGSAGVAARYFHMPALFVFARYLGGVSVYEPQPSWQTSFVAAGTDTLVQGAGTVPAEASRRDILDVSFVADPDVTDGGAAEAIAYDGRLEAVGGTSLASPVSIAMQAAINGVQGSRNGFVNPRLYAIAAAEYKANGTTGAAGLPGNYSFALRDITAGNDGTYNADNGYHLATGLGSLLG